VLKGVWISCPYLKVRGLFYMCNISPITWVGLYDMWGPRLKYLHRGPWEATQRCDCLCTLLLPGTKPRMPLWGPAGLTCLVATLPLVGGDGEGLHYPLCQPTNCGWQVRKHCILTDPVLSHHTVGCSMALDRLSRWCAGLSGRVIHFGIDHPGPLWTISFVENPALVGPAYPISE
jgi:hypothetical protein